MAAGLFLAALIGIGFVIIFKKLPPWLQGFISRRYLLFDLLVAWIVFNMLGFFVLGIYAAGFIALFVSVYLWWYKKKNPPKPKVKKTKKQRLIRVCARMYNIGRG